MYVEADGQKVRGLREEQGAPAKEVAERAGISPSTLRRVEGNRGPVLPATVHGIGHALDTDPRTFARAISRRREREGSPA